MRKRIIQVPMDESLVTAFDELSRKRRRSRSALIREACHVYLSQEERQELDERYQEGYKRIPEEPAIGLAQMELVAQVLSEEEW